MIQRALREVVRVRLRRFPAVGIVGARQCGKTTLARQFGGRYFDLEQPGHRTRLDVEWDALCDGRDLLILDEAQEWPEIFPRLRGAIDADRKRTGRFLVLGSVSPALMERVSESLAGRLSVVELTPFLLSEVADTSLHKHWLFGGYPDGGLLEPTAYPQWQRDYLSLLAQRDLPRWGLPARPALTERLLRMTAAVHGQLWNASKTGQSLGISHTTVNHYLDFLEGAFLVRRLPPYAANLKKRLVKSPRVYWRDSGLLHALLGVRDFDDLLVQPWAGASWEGFVIEQILNTLAVRELGFEACFFRTSDDYEADLVLDFGTRRWAIEIKLTSQPAPEDLQHLNKVADMIGAERRILISQTRRSSFSTRQISCSLAEFLHFVREQR
jgi:uncharacterized protein